MFFLLLQGVQAIRHRKSKAAAPSDSVTEYAMRASGSSVPVCAVMMSPTHFFGSGEGHKGFRDIMMQQSCPWPGYAIHLLGQ
jgi:hypothetical protein